MYVIFITYLYGAVLPILFPICLLNLVIFWACERLSIFYAYQSPPMYQDTMTKYTIRTLFWAPILYLMVACYAYSNQQVFFNSTVPLQQNFIYPLYGHELTEIITQLSPSTPLFIALLFFLVVVVLLKTRFCCKSFQWDVVSWLLCHYKN